MPAGSRERGWACYFSLSALHHVGRRSGRTYMTPLSADSLGDGFVLAVAYPKVDWCDNVLTAGKCTLTWNGKGYALQRPELIGRREAMKGLSAAGQAVRDCPRHETIPVAA
jgi:hypothetical protein